MIVGFEVENKLIRLNTIYSNIHDMSLEEARKLGRALIATADLAEALEKWKDE